jgi:hypothetical protein
MTQDLVEKSLRRHGLSLATLAEYSRPFQVVMSLVSGVTDES